MKPLFVRIHLSIIFNIIGKLLMLEGVLMLSATAFTDLHLNNFAFSLPMSAAITFLAGFVFFSLNRKARKEDIGSREGTITATLSLVIFSLFGCLPYILSNTLPNFTDAFFESISGFTTTGATALTQIESVPRDILFWRSLTQWIGGLGVIIFTITILPYLGIGGMQVFMAELNGITFDRMHPRVKRTGKFLAGLYIFLTLLEFAMLTFGDMNAFDAINISFTTMSSGGFSIRNDSIASFSIYSQYVIFAFMILSGTNLILLFIALRGKPLKLLKDENYDTYIGLIVVSAAIITVGLIFWQGQAVEPAIRQSLVTAASVISTTGFSVVDYQAWPTFLWSLLFFLMFVGACAGSTTGGIKIIRLQLLIKNAVLELSRTLHPTAIIPVKINKKSVSQEIISKTTTFFLTYLLVFICGVIILRIIGIDLRTSFGASIASLSNIGPGLGQVGPFGNYAFMPDVAKWLLGFFMLLGRLELFAVLILFSKHFWKN